MKCLVIIPAYNEEENIVRVVENLKNNYPMYDYVVINDGSADSTAKICRKYGYELVEEVSKVVDVNEGTIYPLLKRLTNERYFETYLRESTEGPPRKYYHLTAAGVLYRDSLEAEWNQLTERVGQFLEECRHG